MSEDPDARKAGDADATTEREKAVTFRDLFAIREYRALYISLVTNWVGDYLARAAITILVYEQSQSVLLSAAAFAVSYLPWIIGGTLLSALAERYPYRRVLITADVYRMVLIALLLIPHTPIPVMLLIVFLASLGTPPTQAARSALQPLVVGRDKLPIAIATNTTSVQAAQVFGYLAGAALASAINPQVALVIDLVTFAVSAALIVTMVQPRPPAHTRAHRTHLLHESAEGFRLVFGAPTLRAIAIMVFVLTMFAIVPEGLAAAWAAESNGDAAARGLNQGLIMAAGPIGFVIGGLLINRLAGPALRDRLVRPLAVLSALALVPAVTAPPPPIVAVLVAISGIAQGGVMPTLNGKFVLILPHGYRARAYGVMQTGLQLSQFAAVMVTGLLADHYWLPLVVGLWSVGGTVALGLLAYRWPRPATFTAATEAAALGQPPTPAPPPRPTVATTSVTPERP
ncbi:MFS transporter [Actinoplanes sp. LDG1-06]|uniref:MFS transporter n=1 Tax=Paractinoplanes ovalisporus TaxID=2810368 RepID=A0ABS2AUK8_9ACTN|nr:MFS transporter [Actinoplanes ovalisporus]MBM2623547.1 MFS transporter [Actinoplanes ovalisporus]